MTSTPFGGGRSRVDSIATQLLDGVVRVELPSARDQTHAYGAGPEVYLLVNTTAKTTTVVMPRSMQYWETKLGSAAGQRSRRVISDIDVSGHSVGSGGTVNGYATTRYRIDTRYTETSLPSRRGEDRKRVHVVEDIWVADAVEGVSDPMQAYHRVVASSGAVDELAEKQNDVRRKLFEGLPVRTTWLYTQTFDGGWKASRTLTIDLLHLKLADLDREAFRVPDGYSRIDLAERLKAAFDLMLSAGKEARKEAAAGRKTP